MSCKLGFLSPVQFVAMLKRKPPPAEADGGTNYEKMNSAVIDGVIGYVFKKIF